MAMANGEMSVGTPNYLMPSLDSERNWGSTGAIALRAALQAGSAPGVLSLLKTMDATGMAKTLGEAGFKVRPEIVAQGRAAVFASVQQDLSNAIAGRSDGYALINTEGRAARAGSVDLSIGPTKTTAPARRQQVGQVAGFKGDLTAANAVQGMLSAPRLSVEALGEALPQERGSLTLIAGQAMKKGIQGFAFDGLDGKFKVRLSMEDIVELHRGAAQSVATESARTSLASWAKGEKGFELSDWVPDSVQRLLHGSLSAGSAQAIVNAIEGGSIARHAGEIGVHTISALLMDQGLDVTAPTVKEQARAQELIIIQPDRQRGQYFGPVVGVDHRAMLVKRSQNEVIELAFEELPKDVAKPSKGEALRIGFNAGTMTLNKAQRPERETISR